MAPDDLDLLDKDLDLAFEAALKATEGPGGDVGPIGGLDMDAILHADPLEDVVTGPRPFDFNRPRGVSRAFGNSLQAVAEAFAKSAGIDFTGLVRGPVQVEYGGLRQGTYAEYVVALPNPTCAALFTLEPLQGPAILHLDPNLCFVLMQRLLGGALAARTIVREFTEIERGISAALVERFLEILRRSLAKYVETRPSLVRLEDNPAHLGGMAEGESLIILGFTLQAGPVEGRCDLVLPLAAFGPVRDIFDPIDRADVRPAIELRENRRRILDAVQGTASELTVELGACTASLQEVLALKEGRVLHLAQAVDAPLTVRIEGRDSWLGEPAGSGPNRTVRLVRKLTKE